MAIIILLCLPAFPFTARFLTKKQRVIAVARLRDHRPKSHGGTGGWKAVRLVLTDPHCWGFVIIYSTCECKPKADSLTRVINFSRHTLIFSCGFPILSSDWQQSRSMLSDIPHHLAERLFRHCRLLPAYGLYYLVLIFDPPSYMSSHFLLLINKLGYSTIQAEGLTAGPYFAGMFIVWLQAWHSDKTRDRGYHIMSSAIMSIVGYLILIIYSEKNHIVSYIATYLVVAGIWSLFPLVMYVVKLSLSQATLTPPSRSPKPDHYLVGLLRSWAANTMSPTLKRGIGTAFIVSFSNLISMCVN